MGYYAAYLDLGNRVCLVLGDGPEARAKVAGLEQSGARVRVRAAGFEPNDLDGIFMVIDASLDDGIGIEVSREARRRGVLVNVLDRPALCDFIAPALVRRGPLQVAISTAGRSPFMASHLRRLLETFIGEEWGILVELTGRLRDRLRADGVPLEEQNQAYARIPGSGALEFLRQGDLEAARAAVEACHGPAPAGAQRGPSAPTVTRSAPGS